VFELSPAVEADGVDVGAAVACGEGVTRAVGEAVAVNSTVGLTCTVVGVDPIGAVVAVGGTDVGLGGAVGGTAALVRVGPGLTGVPAGCPIGPGNLAAAAFTALYTGCGEKSGFTMAK